MGPNPLLVGGGKGALCTSSRPFVHFAHGMDDSELLAGISRLENPFEGPNSARFGRSAFITSACTSGFAKLDLHSSRHCRRSESTGVMPDPPAKALARRTGVPTQHTAKVRPDPFTNACKCKAQNRNACPCWGNHDCAFLCSSIQSPPLRFQLGVLDTSEAGRRNSAKPSPPCHPP